MKGKRNRGRRFRRRGGRIKTSRCQRGGYFAGSRRQAGGRRRKQQRGGIAPILIPLIAAGISAAGGLASNAVHAAISRQ